MIRPSKEWIKQRQINQTQEVDGVVESISEVLVNIAIVVLICSPGEVEITRQRPAGRDVAGKFSQILQKPKRIPVVGRRIHVSESKLQVRGRRGEENSKRALPFDERGHAERSRVPRSQQATTGSICVNTREIGELGGRKERAFAGLVRLSFVSWIQATSRRAGKGVPDGFALIRISKTSNIPRDEQEGNRVSIH